MGENQPERKITVEEFERVKRDSKIMMICSIIMVLIVFAVVFLPVISKPSWHQVVSFSSSSENWEEGYLDVSTDSFNVQYDHWRIKWQASTPDLKPSEDAYFEFYVHKEGEFGVFDVELVNFTDAGFKRGIEYVTGSGNFYFEIGYGNVDYWLIVIDTFN